MNDIQLMLSDEVMAYYENEYDTIQASIILNNQSTFLESELIGRELQKYIPKNSKIMDIGSGSCQWFKFIAENVSEYKAIDSSKVLLLKAKWKYGGKIKLIHCDIFEDNIISKIVGNSEIILLSFFLSHFSDYTVISLLKNLAFYQKPIIIIDSIQHPHRIKFKGLKLIDRKISGGNIAKIPKRYFRVEEIINFSIQSAQSNSFLLKGEHWFLSILSPQK